MRLHIQCGEDILNVDFDLEDNFKVERSKDSQSKTIRLHLEEEQRKALKAAYVLMGNESGPLFWAIQSIAAEAFGAGQRMTRYK